nr:MAG TPA: hypothetical protein [Caudoviricetes sp.]
MRFFYISLYQFIKMNLILNPFYRRFQSFLLSYAPTQNQKK